MVDIFLICPVRNVTQNQELKIREYVLNLESQGFAVYWPQRDTNQDDPIGTRICADNFKAIREAKEVHVWWTTTSTGTLFDLGIAWAENKPLIIANPQDIQSTDGSKSFQNVLLNWSDGFEYRSC